MAAGMGWPSISMANSGAYWAYLAMLLHYLPGRRIAIRKRRQAQLLARRDVPRIVDVVGDGDGPPGQRIVIVLHGNAGQSVARIYHVDFGEIRRLAVDFLGLVIGVDELVEGDGHARPHRRAIFQEI